MCNQNLKSRINKKQYRRKNAEEYPKLDIKTQIQETTKLHILYFKLLETNGNQGQRENVNSCQNNNNKKCYLQKDRD